MVSTLRKQKDLGRKESTRQGLMDAAVEVFSYKGYHRTKISDIVAQAGVGQGTFYRHFKDKREMFESIMERFGRLLLGQFDFMSVNLPDSVEQYHASSLDAISAMADLVGQNRELTLLMLREGPTVDREFEKQINELLEQFASLAAFYLEHAVSKGFARKCSAQLVAQAIVGMGLRHITLWLNDEDNSLDIDEMIRELVDFAFGGIGV